MRQEPRFEYAPAMTFIGISVSMSFDVNTTGQLWRSFMPRRGDIRQAIGTELYSIEQYPGGFFDVFDPARPFTKWAAVAVKDDAPPPPGMDRLVSPAGLYAVFQHKGPATQGPQTYRFIFGTWIPQSGYAVDDRPHLAVMGQGYDRDSPDSEEELWIPVKPLDKALV